MQIIVVWVVEVLVILEGLAELAVLHLPFLYMFNVYVKY